MPSRDLIERVRKALGDRYTVITAVGRGGNASIFGAYDQAGQRVAIKVLHPELAVSVAADRFLREIRYASQLNHPHIARLIATSGEDRVTRSGFVVGTEEYMSPEQAAGVPDVDGRTDLYSLGVVLFEAMAGRPPFSSVSAAAVLDMHQHQKPPDIRSLRRDVPKALSPVLARALAKQREERWQTAGEMASALRPFAEGVGME